MKKHFKKTFFCLIFLTSFLLWGNAEAACTGSSPNWTAADCSEEEVSDCITKASSGDTIIVPAGSATWTGSVRIPNNKKLTLQGSGVGVTIISRGSGTSYYLALGLSGSRITGFTFNNMPVLYNGSGFRIDRNYFYGAASSVLPDEGVDVEYAIPMGLIDNNSFLNGRIVAAAGLMLNNTDWTLPTNLGKGNAAIYIEDNSFVKDDNGVEYCLDGNYGGAYVFRYNTIKGYYYAGHSVQGANRALKRWEIYGNLQTSTDGITTYYATRLRGGTGVVFFNRFEGKWGWSGKMYIGLDNVRSTANVATYGKCDGTHAGVDGNEDATGYPCRDQIGRGPDATLWNGTNGTYTQPLEPAYFFANIGDSGNATVDVLTGSTDHIKANRDYYTHNVSFNGTSGVGCGTLANRPATCTTGVGYWATDQDNCSDLTGYVGDSTQRTSGINTYIQGTLYKCTSTDTWEEYYTPYTYPHPLRTEANDIVAPASPTGLAVS